MLGAAAIVSSFSFYFYHLNYNQKFKKLEDENNFMKFRMKIQEN